MGSNKNSRSMYYVPFASLSNLLPRLSRFWLASWTLFYTCRTTQCIIHRAAHLFYSLSTVFSMLLAVLKPVRSSCISSVKEKVRISQGTRTQNRVASFTDPDRAAREGITDWKLEWSSRAVWWNKTIHEFRSLLKNCFKWKPSEKWRKLRRESEIWYQASNCTG